MTRRPKPVLAALAFLLAFGIASRAEEAAVSFADAVRDADYVVIATVKEINKDRAVVLIVTRWLKGEATANRELAIKGVVEYCAAGFDVADRLKRGERYALFVFPGNQPGRIGHLHKLNEDGTFKDPRLSWMLFPDNEVPKDADAFAKLVEAELKKQAEQKAHAPALTKEEQEALAKFDAALAGLGAEEFQRRQDAKRDLTGILKPIAGRVFNRDYIEQAQKDMKTKEDHRQGILHGPIAYPDPKHFGKELSIQCEGQPLRAVLAYFSGMTSLKISAEPKEAGNIRVSIKEEDLSCRHALWLVCQSRALWVDCRNLEKGIVVVRELKWLRGSSTERESDTPQTMTRMDAANCLSTYWEIPLLDACMLQAAYKAKSRGEDFETKSRINAIFDELKLPALDPPEAEKKAEAAKPKE